MRHASFDERNRRAGQRLLNAKLYQQFTPRQKTACNHMVALWACAARGEIWRAGMHLSAAMWLAPRATWQFTKWMLMGDEVKT